MSDIYSKVGDSNVCVGSLSFSVRYGPPLTQSCTGFSLWFPGRSSDPQTSLGGGSKEVSPFRRRSRHGVLLPSLYFPRQTKRSSDDSRHRPYCGRVDIKLRSFGFTTTPTETNKDNGGLGLFSQVRPTLSVIFTPHIFLRSMSVDPQVPKVPSRTVGPRPENKTSEAQKSPKRTDSP